MAVTPFDTPQDLSGTRLLLRASLNVPVEGGRITNAFRLKESLKTIELFAARGARLVVLGHIGSAKTDSLRPVFEALRKETPLTIRFAEDVAGPRSRAAAESLRDGEVLLLENVRRDPGEENNSPDFAARLASLGDVYVNDAFSDSHRTHASIIGVPKLLPHFAGPNFIREMEGILPARTPKSPSIAVIGGAKFQTKEPLLSFLLERYDHVFVGGALANDFFKAKGYEVGVSLISGNAKYIIGLLKNSKLILPSSLMVLGPNGVREVSPDGIAPSEQVLDVAPGSFAAVAPFVAKAKSILWNGPMGKFEHGFTEGTETLVKLIVASKAESVIGGRDTVAVIEQLGIRTHFTHVSAAGGAMLKFIADGTLVGIEALG